MDSAELWTPAKGLIIVWIGLVTVAFVLNFVACIRLWRLFVINRKRSYEIDPEVFVFLSALRHVNLMDFLFIVVWGVPEILNLQSPWPWGDLSCRILWAAQNALIFIAFLLKIILAASSILYMHALRHISSVNSRLINGLLLLAHPVGVALAVPVFINGEGTSPAEYKGQPIELCKLEYRSGSRTHLLLGLWFLPLVIVVLCHIVAAVLRCKTPQRDGRLPDNPFEKRRIVLTIAFLLFWLAVVAKVCLESSPLKTADLVHHGLNIAVFSKALVSAVLLLGFSSDEMMEENLTFVPHSTQRRRSSAASSPSNSHFNAH